MKICSNCGKKIDQKKSVCPYCGMKTTLEKVVEKEEQPKSVYRLLWSKLSVKTKVILIAFLSFLLLLFISFPWLFLFIFLFILFFFFLHF